MMNLAEAFAHHTRARPTHIALMAGTRSIDYRALHVAVERDSAALASLGAREGDVVGLALKDTIEHVVLFYALARLGLVILPMDWRWSQEEKARIARHFAPRFVLVEEGATIDGVPCVALDDVWTSRVATSPRVLDYPQGGDLPLLVSLSSGTTGRPKGPLLTHHQFFRRFMTHWINLGLNAGDRYVSATPLYFGGGRTFAMSVLFAGGTVALFPPPYEPAELASEVARRAATSLFLVPTLLRRLLELSPEAAEPLQNLRLLLSSGSALHAEERRAIRSRLCPQFFEYYASTEGGGVSLLTPDDQETRGKSVGRPVFGVDVEIVDDEHRVLPAGETGRLRYRGPGVARGFFRETEGDPETFREGWFYPGDVASLDDAGYVYLKGRRKDLIIRGGVNIYPEDIEFALAGHPAVVDAAVAGLPHREFGEQVAAFVVTREPVTQAALIDWCRARLAAYKVPQQVQFLSELPRNSSGKVLKTKLIDEAVKRGSQPSGDER
jgi:acyl-CoA synthetase (AMP-forming)/AMP-acid ligase II